MTYRADIDGLRGIAILFVVLFHFFPETVPAGFIGVDIFFVISGFLITGILYGELKAHNLRLAHFYARRIRRLFPALLTVLVGTLFLGWLILLPEEYLQLAIQTLSGLGFVANFFFWSQSGYFDGAAITKPLLHLWSLAIEEQFYLVFPFFFLALYKRKQSILLALFLTLVLSFLVNVVLASLYPVADFYSPFSRFWEILCGSWLAVFMANRPASLTKSFSIPLAPTHSNTQATFGLILLSLGLLLIKTSSPFPGWWALLPVLGTFFLLLAGPSAIINRLVLSNRALVSLGLISYPLYLWHWPLLSLARIAKSEALNVDARLALVGISLLLAFATYWLIEKPIRFSKYMQHKKRPIFALIFLAGVLACAALLILVQEGIPKREVVLVNPRQEPNISAPSWQWMQKTCELPGLKPNQFEFCAHDTRGPNNLILVGDSKADALFPGLIETASPQERWSLVRGTLAYAILPLLTPHPLFAPFQKNLAQVIGAINADPKIEVVVFAVAARSLFALNTAQQASLTANTRPAVFPNPEFQGLVLQGLEKTVQALLPANKKIIFVVDNPHFPDASDCLDRKTGSSALNQLLRLRPNPRCTISIEAQKNYMAAYLNTLNQLPIRYPGKVFVFDTVPLLCNTQLGMCEAAMRIEEINPQNHYLYAVTDHLSFFAASRVGAELNRFILEILH
jgi:peptidoglycan/LPS O-acetylase OafA/YrhL